MLTWVSNTSSFAVVLVYFIVSLSFLKLRKKDPGRDRPYKVAHGRAVGVIACILTLCLIALCIPGMPSGFTLPELIILGIWVIFGAVLSRFAPGKAASKDQA